jgi:hypothetical protein
MERLALIVPVLAMGVVLLLLMIAPQGHAVVFNKCIHGLNLLGYPNTTAGFPTAKTICDELQSHHYYLFLQHNDTTTNDSSAFCTTMIVECINKGALK